jgi:hypothetical protein
MGGGGDDGRPSQAAIPLIAGAIVLAQVTMVRLGIAFQVCL